MAKKSKAAKNCSELCPGDEVSGCYTSTDGCECHVNGVVLSVEDDGNVKIMYTHLHSACVDPANLSKC